MSIKERQFEIYIIIHLNNLTFEIIVDNSIYESPSLRISVSIISSSFLNILFGFSLRNNGISFHSCWTFSRFFFFNCFSFFKSRNIRRSVWIRVQTRKPSCIYLMILPSLRFHWMQSENECIFIECISLNVILKEIWRKFWACEANLKEISNIYKMMKTANLCQIYCI